MAGTTETQSDAVEGTSRNYFGIVEKITKHPYIAAAIGGLGLGHLTGFGKGKGMLAAVAGVFFLPKLYEWAFPKVENAKTTEQTAPETTTPAPTTEAPKADVPIAGVEKEELVPEQGNPENLKKEAEKGLHAYSTGEREWNQEDVDRHLDTIKAAGGEMRDVADSGDKIPTPTEKIDQSRELSA